MEKQPKTNLFVDTDGKALVSRVKATSDLEASVRKAVDLIGGLRRLVAPSDEVIVKPNYNSDDPFPASSDPEFVKTVVKLLYASGASKVKIMESSGLPWRPTQKVLDKTGLTKAAEEAGAELVVLDKRRWVKVAINGVHWKKVTFPADLVEADNTKLVWLPCMKTHRYARFSLSLKLAVGLLGFRQRANLHMRHLEEKIAEINLAVHPDLIIMDARKCFVSGGPDKGQVEQPDLILASGDRVAIDTEALKVLKSYKAENRLDMQPWEFSQIRHAVRLGIGVNGEDGVKVVSD